MPVEIKTVQQAYKFALDPTPRQARMLASHAGGARFAYNWGNAAIIAALDAQQAEKAAGGKAETKIPGHFDLCKQWTAWKDAHAGDPEPAEGERRTNTAWVSENFSGTYQAALRDAAKAWSDFFKSRNGQRKGRRLGRPKFKKHGKARDSFQVHGDGLRVENCGAGFRAKGAGKGATRDMVVLPKIGPVFLHETARKLRRRLRKASVVFPECCGWGSPGTVPAPADSKAKSAVPCPSCMIPCPACGEPDPACEELRAACGTCGGTGHIRNGELDATCGTCDDSGKVRECPACGGVLRIPAARIVRGTVARESDGRWFVALTVELAREVRAVRVKKKLKNGGTAREYDPAPSPRQRKGGTVGVDFGVRELATLSDGTVIPNPRPLEAAQARLRQANKSVARCQPGSRKREKAVRRVGRLHARVRVLRLDAMHKATSSLVHSHDLIAVEGFDAQETVRYRRNGKADPKKNRENVPAKVRADRNRAMADTGIGIARW